MAKTHSASVALMQDGSGYRVSYVRWEFLQHEIPSNTGVIYRKCSSANLFLGNKTGVRWFCVCVCGARVRACVWGWGGGLLMCVCVCVCRGGVDIIVVCLLWSMVYLSQGNKYNEYHTPQANVGCLCVCVWGGGGGYYCRLFTVGMVHLWQGNKYNECHPPLANVMPGLLSSLK